jgi:hypothetical protein
MNKVSIYRNGLLTASEYTGEVKEFAENADKDRPYHLRERPGRVGSLYASPTLFGVCRWARANLFNSRYPSVETHEIKVDADNVYVYCVNLWEDHSWHGGDVYEYWNSGVTLTDWLADGSHDAREWEVLIREEDIIGTPRRVSRKRLVAASGEKYDDLDSMLKYAKVK